MDALPYYKWLWIDYRANRKVQRMSWQAKGLYRELLDEFWSEGFLPADMESLADICGCTVEEFTEFWPQIKPCWTESDRGYVNPKMDEQRTKVDMQRVANARNGTAGAIAKLANASDRVANASDRVANASDRQEPSSDRHIAEQEQSRAEQEQLRTPEVFQASITDQANACARKVMFEAPLSGMKVLMALEQTARHEISTGIDLNVVADAMLSAWREFKTAQPKLEYAWGAEKFFGEGNWKARSGWPWKDGMAPRQASPTVNPLDLLRAKRGEPAHA